MMRHFSELTPAAERVLDVAEGLVQLHGYNGFSYDDIARAVGVKKPSIHHHFATKAELVRIVAQRYTHKFRTAVLALEGQSASALARLQAYAKLFADTYARDRRLCVCGMLGTGADDLPEPVAMEVQRFFLLNVDWLGTVIAAGQADGSMRAVGSPSALAHAYLGALEGAMVIGRGLGQDAMPTAIANALLSSWRQ